MTNPNNSSSSDSGKQPENNQMIINDLPEREPPKKKSLAATMQLSPENRQKILNDLPNKQPPASQNMIINDIPANSPIVGYTTNLDQSKESGSSSGGIINDLDTKPKVEKSETKSPRQSTKDIFDELPSQTPESPPEKDERDSKRLPPLKTQPESPADEDSRESKSSPRKTVKTYKGTNRPIIMSDSWRLNKQEEQESPPPPKKPTQTPSSKISSPKRETSAKPSPPTKKIKTTKKVDPNILWESRYSSWALTPSFILAIGLTAFIIWAGLQLMTGELLLYITGTLCGTIWLFQLTRWSYRILGYRYRLTREHLFHGRGLLYPSEKIDLSQIKQVTVVSNLMEKLTLVGRIVVEKADPAHPPVVMEGILWPKASLKRLEKAMDELG